MTRPSEIEKGRGYHLPGNELSHYVHFINEKGKASMKPVFVPSVFSYGAVYNGPFLADGENYRCNACHRSIRRGYKFMDPNEGTMLHFGRSCIIRHVDAKPLDKGGDAQ